MKRNIIPYLVHKLSLQFILFILGLIISNTVLAQHDMHQMKKDPVKKDTAAKMEKEHEHHHDSMPMTSLFSPNLQMNRDGSGTSWQPDQSPMMMYMKMFGIDKHGVTSFRAHGNIFLRYNSQDIFNKGDRGGQQFSAPNWFMLMLTHSHPKDVFSLLTMFSFDRLTEGGNGYPLLFQSGETYKNKPLVDRQHPHDLFAELAFNYTHSFTKDIDLNGYIGYPAEPALGPNVFMHRVSAMNNPSAPLGHHWQDATHITFGVGTLGLRYKIVKGEASIFTGREPDENRYNFDKPRFDSYSYRISINPNRHYSFQFSQGYIKSPEALEPEVDIVRTTASVIHTKTFKQRNSMASSLVWGQNFSSEGQRLNSILLESNLMLTPINLYTRYEFVQKDAHELNLEDFEEHSKFNINAFTFGINRVLYSKSKTDLSLGLQATINVSDEDLKGIYGNTPIGGEVYLRINPTPMVPKR